MPRTLLAPKSRLLAPFTGPRPISLGGTGADNAAAAITNLQIIPRSQIAARSGVAQLGIDGKVPAQQFNPGLLNNPNPIVTGPMILAIGQTATYTIANYDAGLIYQINTVVGTVSISGNTITYTAPTTVGVGGFIVNGAQTKVSIADTNITVTGPNTLDENTTATYTIPNYNAAVAYKVEAVSGHVSINDAIITYIAPAINNAMLPLYGGFYLNGTLVSVLVNPPPTPIVIGPASMVLNTGATFRITNYVRTGTYIVSCEAGNITQSEETLHYQAPNEVGVFGFRVNTKHVSVNVVKPIVSMPVINSPANDAVRIGRNTFVQASKFTVTFGTDEHAASDWELSHDEKFQFVALSNYRNTRDLNSWYLENLNNNSIYYVRVRYVSKTGVESQWSEPVKFTTKAVYYPDSIDYTLTAGQLGYKFGHSVDISEDDTTMAVGCPSGNLVYIFKKLVTSPDKWTLRATIKAPTSAVLFGTSVDVNAAGNVVIVGSPGNSQAYIYVYRDDTWQQTTSLKPLTPSTTFGMTVTISDDLYMAIVSDPINNTLYFYHYENLAWNTSFAFVNDEDTNFGHSLAMSNDGGLILSGFANAKSVVLYTWIASGITRTQTFYSPVVIGNAGGYGSVIALAKQTYTIAIAAPGLQTVYIYRSDTGIVWNLYQTLYNPEPGVDSNFGCSLSFDANGSILMVGASQTGKAYVYTNTGSQYSLKQTFQIDIMPKLGSTVKLNADGSHAILFDTDHDIAVVLK